MLSSLKYVGIYSNWTLLDCELNSHLTGFVYVLLKANSISLSIRLASEIIIISPDIPQGCKATKAVTRVVACYLQGCEESNKSGNTCNWYLQGCEESNESGNFYLQGCEESNKSGNCYLQGCEESNESGNTCNCYLQGCEVIKAITQDSTVNNFKVVKQRKH